MDKMRLKLAVQKSGRLTDNSLELLVRCGLKFHIVAVEVGAAVHPCNVLNHWGMDVGSKQEVDRAHENAIKHKDKYNIRQVLPVAFTSVHYVKTFRACRLKNVLDRPNRRTGQGEIISHFIHVTSFSAEIGLHVDDQDHRILRAQIAIVRPGIRVCGGVRHLGSPLSGLR